MSLADHASPGQPGGARPMIADRPDTRLPPLRASAHATTPTAARQDVPAETITTLTDALSAADARILRSGPQCIICRLSSRPLWAIEGCRCRGRTVPALSRAGP